jgi:hypothetical protein
LRDTLAVTQTGNDGDDSVKRGMARALKDSWGMALADHERQTVVVIGTPSPALAATASRTQALPG